MPIKELGLHAKIQGLQQLLLTLSSLMHPTVVQKEGDFEVLPSPLGEGVRTSVQTAMIKVCNRICDIAADDANWVQDQNAGEAEALLGMLVKQAMEDTAAGKKGESDEEQHSKVD